jgi:hypothetical protein
VLCSLLAGFYLTFKGYGLLQQGQLLLVAAKLVMRSGALYGRYVGKAEAKGACCPICQVGTQDGVPLAFIFPPCDRLPPLPLMPGLLPL